MVERLSNTEEAAVFDSCSAYQQSRPHILFLSHCVPNPPDKGEKIRAHYELKALCRDFNVHLVCFARNEREVADAHALSSCCASVRTEIFKPKQALLKAGAKFAFGACLNEEYYSSGRIQRHVNAVATRVHIEAAFVYTAVMAPYVPADMPHVLDMVDVDSEKWFQYARMRRPGFLYAAEGRRMQRFEAQCAVRAAATAVVTGNEAQVLQRFVPDKPIHAIENGVDSDYFDGVPRPLPGGERRFIAFIGTMDYLPNIEATVRFASDVFPELRGRAPDLEFFIVGRNPSRQVKDLQHRAGIHVTGSVPDVRPYLSQARAIVAPLALARGVQNKVLEALAMGRSVFASDAVCRTFHPHLPAGVLGCESNQAFVEALESAAKEAPGCNEAIRRSTVARFSWDRNMEQLASQMMRVLPPVASAV